MGFTCRSLRSRRLYQGVVGVLQSPANVGGFRGSCRFCPTLPYRHDARTGQRKRCHGVDQGDNRFVVKGRGVDCRSVHRRDAGAHRFRQSKISGIAKISSIKIAVATAPASQERSSAQRVAIPLRKAPPGEGLCIRGPQGGGSAISDVMDRVARTGLVDLTQRHGLSCPLRRPGGDRREAAGRKQRRTALPGRLICQPRKWV
jgi:hypothetical protein